MVINGTGRYPKPKVIRYDIVTAAGGGKPSGEWSAFRKSESPKDYPPLVRNAPSASSKKHKLGFVLGGALLAEKAKTPYNWNAPNPDELLLSVLDTMRIFNFTSSQWSPPLKNPDAMGSVIDGILVTLDDVGKEGVLVFFGGDSTLLSNMVRYILPI